MLSTLQSALAINHTEMREDSGRCSLQVEILHTITLGILCSAPITCGVDVALVEGLPVMWLDVIPTQLPHCQASIGNTLALLQQETQVQYYCCC
jgi:hypothetical protein